MMCILIFVWIWFNRNRFVEFVITRVLCSLSREGAIIEWPLNGQFHDARDVILTSRTDVREMVDDDDEWPLVIYIYIYITS